ncbi:hypothetical protein [Phenylobacterium sp.]|uniref:DUF4376 domain-containing protein n=1 Tax=Phenylobacterium sp. TaxID=1871053 RepID=UPI00391D8D6F
MTDIAYAAQDPQGAWFEIRGPFALGEGEALMRYPSDWLAKSTPEERAAIGVVEILEVERPADPTLKVLGSGVEDFEGQPRRTWSTEPHTPAGAAALKKAAIEAQFGGRMFAGFPVPGHPGEFLQLRDSTDRTNWLTLKGRAKDRCDGGQATDPCALPVRTMANTYIAGLTYDETRELMDQLLDWGAALLQHRWDLKDAVDLALAAEDVAAILAIDETAGWPG